MQSNLSASPTAPPLIVLRRTLAAVLLLSLGLVPAVVMSAVPGQQGEAALEGTWQLDANLSDDPSAASARGGGRGGGGGGGGRGGGRGGSGGGRGSGAPQSSPLLSATRLETSLAGGEFVVRAGSSVVRSPMAEQSGGPGAAWEGQRLVVRTEQEGPVLSYEVVGGDRLVLVVEMRGRDGGTSTLRRVFERVE